MIQALRAVPAVLIMLTSIYLSSLPKIEAMPAFWNADKLVHLVCFGGFAFWVAFAMSAPLARRRLTRALWLAPVLFIAAYGAVDEFHQSFTPGRSCSVPDWCADAVGGAIGSYAHGLLLFSKWRVGRYWRAFAGVEG